MLLEQDHAAQVPRVGLVGLERVGLFKKLERSSQVTPLERRACLLEEHITLCTILASWEQSCPRPRHPCQQRKHSRRKERPPTCDYPLTIEKSEK